MSDNIEYLVEGICIRSKLLLAQMEQFYGQNYCWLSPEQRLRLRAGMEDLARLVNTAPGRSQALPQRGAAAFLDSLYNATYGLVGRFLPNRRN
jgi:hypothetical protein